MLIRNVQGDHANELCKICICLEKSPEFAANPSQQSFISKMYESFKTGNIEAYKESQGTWVKDTQPSMEFILGFVERYRDSYGVRAEFEGLVAIFVQPN